MKKGKLLKSIATLGLAVSLATSSAAPAYAAPREYQCVTECKQVNVGKLLTGLVSRIVCNTFGHTYNRGVVVTEPTYKEEGTKKFTCYICGKVKNEPIAKLVCFDHDWVEVEYAECSETEHGYWKDECSICGEVSEGISHFYDSEGKVLVKEATETEHAIYSYPCMICGEREEWEEHIFDFNNPEVIPSEAGSECSMTYSYPCTLCDEVLLDPWHYFEYECVETTEGMDGCEKYTCKKCGFSKEENAVHYFDWDTYVVVSEPNGQHGVANVTCLNCGAIENLDVCEFDYDNAVIIESEGNGCERIIAKCKYCESTVEEVNHNYEYFKEEATEGHDGIYGTRCTKCGDILYSDVMHGYVLFEEEATEDHDGISEVKCIGCGEIISTYVNHYYDYDNPTIIEEAAPGKHEIVEVKCKHCDESITYDRHVYDYDNQELVSEAHDGECAVIRTHCMGCDEYYDSVTHHYVLVSEEETTAGTIYKYICENCGEEATF